MKHYIFVFLFFLFPIQVYGEISLEAGEVYTLSPGEVLDVDGGVSVVSNSVLDGSASNAKVRFSGDWSNQGSVIASDVEAYGNEGSTISGNTTFRTFSCENSTKTLYFAAGSHQTFASGLTLSGQNASSKLKLRSSLTGTQYVLDLQSGHLALSYLDVKDSNLQTSTILPVNSIDSGNNSSLWLFSITLSGQVKVGSSPLSGVVIDGGVLGKKTTDATGAYSFSGLTYGSSYQITPSKYGYSFSAPTATITADSHKTQNFAATLLDSDGDGLSDIDEVAQGTDPTKADTDSDGASDGEEVAAGTDPLDRGSSEPTRPTTLCAEWNGFLGMWNVLEHVNTGASKLNMASTLKDFAGVAQAPVNFSLKSGYQYDLLVHGMTGFEANRYGLICSTASNGQAGDLDGRMVFYKPDAATGGYQFAFAMPLGNGVTGRQYVPYNTYQPSLDAVDATNLAANWIQLTNYSTAKQSGTLVFYDREGVEITRQGVTLKAGARFDYPAHDIAGLKQVGLVEWIPTSIAARFQLRNVRYYYRADGVTVPLGDDFDSAFQLEGLVGSGQLLTVPLDTASSSSVLEIANTLSTEVKAEVSIYAATGGTALHHQTYKLKPHGTYHLIVDTILNGSKGIATVKGNKASSVIATAMQYGRTATLGIQTVYVIQAKEALGEVMRGTYNTFLNQGCWLLMVNPTSAEVVTTVSLKRYDGTVVESGRDFPVAAHGLTDYDLCSADQANVYGVVTVAPATANTIMATVLRIGANEEYRFPTLVRQ